MWFRRRTLIEQDPANLSVEQLSALEEALIAKLILVTGELESRWRNIVALGEGLSGVEESRKALLSGAERLRALNLRLREEIISD